jgi:hypothetical protein
MQHNNIGFNSTWVASVSLEEFKEHEKHHGLTAKELESIHAKCVEENNPKEEKPAKPAKKK